MSAAAPLLDVVCLGEALIDFVALETGTSVGDASGFLKAPGGAPANVAVGLSRLGMRSAFIGKVGADPFGTFLCQTLDNEGVDTSGMRFDAEARTGLAFVSLQQNGERDFAFFRHPSADMRLTVDELDRPLVERALAFHFGSVTQTTEPSRTATRTAAEWARAAGRLVSYDPNLRPALWDSLEEARAVILDALTLVDVLKVSDEELHFLTGESAIERGIAILWPRSESLRLIAVTLGERGSIAATRDGQWRREAGIPVTAIDTTGAGDAFVAGLLATLRDTLCGVDDVAGLTPTEMDGLLRVPNVCGALACTRKGAIPALPTRDEVQSCIASLAGADKGRS